MKDLFGNEAPEPGELVDLSYELALKEATWDEDDVQVEIEQEDEPDLDWGDEPAAHEITGDYVDADDWDLDELELGGEESGELQAEGSDDPFFVSKEAAAVFKHKLLSSYFPKFAGKAGSTEADRRLVYVDTHAGRGQYDDGTAGSPLLIAQNVSTMSMRQIDCFFVEAKGSNHKHLRQVLTQYMPPGAVWETRHGTASVHLPEAVAFAGDSPLFTFIDPYGLGPSFPEVVGLITRPRAGFGRKTEVLLNFISSAFGRTGGYLGISARSSQQERSLTHLDEVLDGPWWREVYLRAETVSAAVEQIAYGYAKRLATAAGGGYISLVPVKNRSHHLPLYWLVHFTWHPDGAYWIGDAAARAAATWRRHLKPPPAEDDGGLFPVEELDPFPAEEQRRAGDWVDLIEANARRLLAARGTLSVKEQHRELFGDAFGQAWSKHLLKALNRVYGAGLLEPRPTSARLERYVGHTPRAT